MAKKPTMSRKTCTFGSSTKRTRSNCCLGFTYKTLCVQKAEPKNYTQLKRVLACCLEQKKSEKHFSSRDRVGEKSNLSSGSRLQWKRKKKRQRRKMVLHSLDVKGAMCTRSKLQLQARSKKKGRREMATREMTSSPRRNISRIGTHVQGKGRSPSVIAFADKCDKTEDEKKPRKLKPETNPSQLRSIRDTAQELTHFLRTSGMTTDVDQSTVDAAGNAFHTFLVEVSDDLDDVMPKLKRRRSRSETPSQLLVVPAPPKNPRAVRFASFPPTAAPKADTATVCPQIIDENSCRRFFSAHTFTVDRNSNWHP